MTLTINHDLQSLIPPLSPEELRQLEENILTHGCRDPLVVWAETETLLDGHHRYAICERHHILFTIHEISLPDLDAARLWMIANQLGRRNLNPNQMSYYRGEQYNLQKQRHGGDRKSGGSSTQNEDLKTGDRLAAEHGVSRATIERNGVYAAAVETLVEVLGPEARKAILAGDLGLTKQDVPVLASLVEASPEVAAQAQAAMQSAAPSDGLRAILTTSQCGICHRPLSNPASISRGIGPICAGHGNGTGGAGGGSRGGMVIHSGAVGSLGISPVAMLVGHFDMAIQMLERLYAALQDAVLPDDLAPHIAACEALGKISRQVEDLTSQHRAFLQAPHGPAPAPLADPAPVLPEAPSFADDPSGLLMGHGKPMRARPYCIVHLKQRYAAFDHCSVQECSQAPHYLFRVQIPRPDGAPAWMRYYELCPAHAMAWCTAHQVDIGAIPTISSAAWGKAFTTGDYDEVPWFRLADHRVSSEVASTPDPTPTRLRDQVGLQQAVLQTVEQLGTCTNAQVKAALGEKRGVVHATLQALVKKGKVVKTGETYGVVDADN